MTKRMLLMLIPTLLVFGAVFGWKWFSGRMMNQYFDSMPVPAATVSTARAGRMSWDNRAEAPGNLVAVNGTDVTTESGGIVHALHFESGATVNRGAKLLTLDASNELAELRKLEAQARLAELNRDRRARLLQSAAVSKSDFDAAQAELAAARAAAEAQASKVAKKEIRAPFSGVLGIRRVNLGQYLAPGTAIVSLQSLDPIDVDFALPEQFLAVVTPGLGVNVRVDAWPDETFKGHVLAIEPRVDEATRNVALRARLPNPNGRLRAGMFGRVELTLPGAADVLAVPRTALSYSSYGTSVFVLQEKTSPPATAESEGGAMDATASAGAEGGKPQPQLMVVQRFVTTGAARGDFVEIVDGLREGEEIATSGLLKLRNEMPVVVDNSIIPQVELDPHPAEG